MADSDLDQLDDIIRQFPEVIPRGPIDVFDEQHQFRDEKDVYFIDKAPVTSISAVTGTLSGSSGHEFEQGTDFQLVDDDGDGEDDSIDWSIGGDTPDNDTDFFVDYRAEAVISRYIDAHDSDINDIESDINEVIGAAQVERADVSDLERIGAIFGTLGKREGRKTESYRSLLKSMVQAFSGRGTKPGMKSAIAAGIGVDPEDITITEDTANTGYEVSVSNEVDTNIIGGIINDMAELADPSGVKLIEAVILLDGDTIDVQKSETTVTATSVGLGGGTLNMDGTAQLQ